MVFSKYLNSKVAIATMRNEKEVQKLRDFIGKRGIQLSDNEIEKIAQNLYELGVFLVRLKVKQHSKQAKTPNARDFEQITREPP